MRDVWVHHFHFDCRNVAGVPPIALRRGARLWGQPEPGSCVESSKRVRPNIRRPDPLRSGRPSPGFLSNSRRYPRANCSTQAATAATAGRARTKILNQRGSDSRSRCSSCSLSSRFSIPTPHLSDTPGGPGTSTASAGEAQRSVKSKAVSAYLSRIVTNGTSLLIASWAAITIDSFPSQPGTLLSFVSESDAGIRGPIRRADSHAA